MIKVLTRFGLLMMNPEERESKLNEVIKVTFPEFDNVEPSVLLYAING